MSTSERAANPFTPYRPLMWGILSLPIIGSAIAMQFEGSGVEWTPGDFMAATVLLGGAGLAVEGLMRVPGKAPYRLAAVLAVFGLLFLVWANLAVGIVGSENDPFNSLYFLAVPLVVLGAILARLKPRGMALTMAAAAAIPVLLAIAALLLGKQHQPLDSVREILVANGLFATIFTASALLFRQAAKREGATAGRS